MLEDFKDLQIRYDALDNENQQNDVMIRNLMSKIESFESRESGEKNHPLSSSVSVQTETILSYQKCDFKVEDIYEFYGHRWTEHEDEELDANMHNIEDMEVTQNDTQNESEKGTKGLECNFCDDTFTTKRIL